MIIKNIFSTLWNWLKKGSTQDLKDFMQEQFNEEKERDEKLQELLNLDKDGTKAAIRHAITDIYFQYLKEKELPLIVKQDLCSLYDVYKKLDGNSYINNLFNEMETWKIK